MKHHIPTPEEIEADVAQRGWTMEDLFKKSSVSRVSVWRWKKGMGMSTLTLQKLLDALR